MEINLLPEVPPSKKYRWPIAIIVGIALISASVFVSIAVWEKSRILTDKEDALQRLQADHDFYMKELNANREQLQLMTDYLEELENAKTKHVDWVSIVDPFIAKLPKDDKIIHMLSSSPNHLHVIAEFKSLSTAAEYVQWIKDVQWVDDVAFLHSSSNKTEEYWNRTEKKGTGEVSYQVELEIKLNLQTLNEEGEIMND